MFSKQKVIIGSALLVALTLGGYYFIYSPSTFSLATSKVSFYSWDNGFGLDTTAYDFLMKHKINHLRIKTLEVGWNESDQKASIDNHIYSYHQQLELDYFRQNSLTPVVFIHNDVFYKIDSTSIPQMASLVKRALQIHLLNLAISQNEFYGVRWEKLYFTLRPHEYKKDSVQKVYDRFLKNIVSYEFDCDWTEKTKDKYFLFLQHAKDTLQASIESTLRLHQYKFRDRMGIPPTDAVNLMCYNTGDLKNIQEKNSIFDTQTILSYLKQQKAYPIPLRVAFPTFGWSVVFRNNHFLKIVQGNITTNPYDRLEKIGGNTFRVTETMYIIYNSEPLQPGDLIRVENVSAEQITETYRQLLSQTEERPEEVIFFDLRSTITKSDFDELEKIFAH